MRGYAAVQPTLLIHTVLNRQSNIHNNAICFINIYRLILSIAVLEKMQQEFVQL
jgi:hypothetical protein